MEKETIIYNGKKYHRYLNSGGSSDRTYFRGHFTAGSPVYLHRQVWKDNYGEIPKGFQVHHKDHNPANNDISNLELLPIRKHRVLHKTEISDEERDRRRRQAVAANPYAKAWHSSAEGIEWHKANGVKVWENRDPFERVCIECGKTFTTKTYHQEYCSNACKSNARRKSGVDNIIAVCEFCGKDFSANKYRVPKFCSVACYKESRKSKIPK